MLKIAHRGASGLAPENTLAAFRKAIELGADMIELDVRRCGSGELVVTHDPILLRRYGLFGLVKNRTLKELKALEADPEKQILTLEEALKVIRGRTALDIELKEGGTAGEVLTIIKANMENGWGWNNLLLSSFHYQQLVVARAECPEIKLVPICLTWPFKCFSFSKKIGAKAIKTNRFFVTQNLIKKVRDHGLEIYVWTVNSPVQIAKFKHWRVDGIISDYPDYL